MLETHAPEDAKRRLTAWWHGEDHGRVTWAIHVARRQPKRDVSAPPEAKGAHAEWCDPDLRLARWEDALAHTDCLGEAIPYFDTNIGPGSLGLFLGAEGHLAPGTVWYEPCLDELTEPDLACDTSGEWWARHMAVIEAGVQAAGGRYYASIPDLVEGLDTLAALRGTEPLLMDLLDRPAAVHAYLRRINELYFEAFDPMYERVRDADGACCFCAFMTWAPGRYAKIQSDISAMLSPGQFAEFVTPYLAEQCERLDYPMYHLDGPECTKHLDELLSIDRLRVIQWTPGAANPPVHDPCWFPMYRRILERKSLILIGTPAEEARAVVEAVGSRGLYLVSWESEANGFTAERGLELLEEAAGW